MAQEAYKLDQESLTKILKGACIAATGAAALYLLSIAGKIDIGNPGAVSFLAWFVPVAVNFVKEWQKGELKKL